MTLRELQQEIVACNRCTRLREHCQHIATVKRRAYRYETYWGKPVPSFGDPEGRMLILGLAPGAHGSNRTGRMFTGDASGDILYRVLHDTGFATRPVSRYADDGLALRDAYITAAAHCAPPDNKPTREEMLQCREFLLREVALLTRVQVVVALGKIAFDTWLDTLRLNGRIGSRSGFVFGHNVLYETGPQQPVLLASYHPSQQNTSTGKLTESMLRDVFARARDLLR